MSLFRKSMRFGWLAVALALAASTPVRAEDCKLVQITSLDAQQDRYGALIVPATIEGHDKLLLIDTAGIYNLLSTSAIDDMHLSREAAGSGIHISMGATGKSLHSVAIAHGFKLGNIVADKMTFLEMPDGMVATGVAGTLGPSVMANYDLELDPAHRKVNLFSQDHCPNQVVYWTHTPFVAIPMRVDSYLHIIIPVTLDGQTFEATVDTGSSISTLTTDLVAGAFGWDAGAEMPPGAAKTADEGYYSYPFKSLSFGGVTVTNPNILVHKDRDLRGEKTPMIIGMTILSKLHIYVSYADHMLFITPADAPPPDAAASTGTKP